MNPRLSNPSLKQIASFSKSGFNFNSLRDSILDQSKDCKKKKQKSENQPKKVINLKNQWLKQHNKQKCQDRYLNCPSFQTDISYSLVNIKQQKSLKKTNEQSTSNYQYERKYRETFEYQLKQLVSKFNDQKKKKQQKHQEEVNSLYEQLQKSKKQQKYLQNISNSINQENKNLRDRLFYRQNNCSEQSYQQLFKKYNTLQKKYLKQNRQNLAAIDLLKKQINELKIKKNKLEVQKQYKIKEIDKVNCQILKIKNSEQTVILNKIIIELKEQNIQLTTQLNDYRKNFKQKINLINYLQDQIKHIKKQLQQVNNQKNYLESQVKKSKQKAFRENKENFFQNPLEQKKLLQDTTKIYKKEIEQLKKLIDSYRMKIEQLGKNIKKQQENDIFQNRLSKCFSDQKNQLEIEQIKNYSLQNKIFLLTLQLENNQKRQNDSNNLYQQKIKFLENQLLQAEKEIIFLNQKYSQTFNTIKQVSQDYESDEFDDNQKKILKIQIEHLKNELEIQKNGLKEKQILLFNYKKIQNQLSQKNRQILEYKVRSELVKNQLQKCRYSK